MQSFENVGFAVELFVVIFGFLCWLVTPAPAHAASNAEEVLEDVVPEYQSNQLIFENNDLAVTAETADSLPNESQSLENALKKLSLKDARKLVKKLIDKNVVQAGTALKGKGCNTQYFVDIARSHLSQHREAIAQSFQEITGQAVA